MEIAFFWELLKSAGALWLGLYVLTRGGAQGRSGMTALALIMWSLSPFSVAMIGVSDAGALQFWLRFLVGVWPITVACIFGMSLSLAGELLPEVRRERLRTIYHAVLILGIVIGTLAAITNLVFDYTTAQQSIGRVIGNSFQSGGTLEPLYNAFRFVMPVLSITVLTLFVLRRWGSSYANTVGVRYVTLAGWIWLVALTLQWLLYDVAANSRTDFIYNHLTDPIYMLAVVLFCWGLVQHNAMMRGRVVRRDFLLSLATLAIIVTAFGLIPWQVGRRLATFDDPLQWFLLLASTWIAVWTHMLFGMAQRWLDKLIIGDAGSLVRGEVDELMQASREGASLDETMDGLSQLRVKALVHESVSKQLLRAMNTVDGSGVLASSQLHQLAIVQSFYPENPTDRQKSSAVIMLLERALDALVSAETTPSTHQQELLQILTLRIRDGLDRSDITTRHHIHPRKYDRLLSDGITQLADAILELEQTIE